MKNVYLITTDIPRFDKYLVLNRVGKLCVWDTRTMGGQQSLLSQNVYITSDEHLKDGEYGISKLNEIIKYHIGHDYRYYSKIVMTNDPKLNKDGVQGFDGEFLDWFVKNPSCEYVGVERECCGQCDERLCEVYDLGIKELDYKIIIPTEDFSNTPIIDIQTFEIVLDEEPKQDFYKIGDFHKDCDDGCKYYCTKGNTQLAECLKEPKQECDGDILTCLNEKCICKHNKIMGQETVEDAAYNEFPNQEFYSSDEWSRAQRTCGREGFIRGSKWQSKKSYTEEEVRCWLIHRDVYLYNYYTTYKNLDIPLQSVEDFIEENHEYLMNRKK